MRVAALSTVVIAGLVTSLLVAAPGLASFPGKPGRIVFDSSAPGRTELIYDYDLRTQKRRALTHRPASCPKASWWDDGGAEYSPNGKLIAYLHSDYCEGGVGHNSLWIVRADGSGQRELASLQGFEVWEDQIAFSPDGRRIALLAAQEGSPTAVAQLLLNAKTGAVVYSHQWPPRSFGDHPELDWGTNGSLAIAWTRHGSVWAVPPRGGSFERLTFPGRPGAWSGGDVAVTFSPSGRTVAFARTEARRGFDQETAPLRYGIWRTSTNKPHRARRLFVTRDYEITSPVFSPDGRQIAFVDHLYAISVIPSSGGRPSRRLLRSRGLGYDTRLDWQPVPRRRDQG
jgi:Tol biopolymer transport system component